MTPGASKAAMMIIQPALAPSPQPRPAPTVRALPAELAVQRGPFCMPIRGPNPTPIDKYDTERCLLSDRGFSQPIEDGPHMAFSFNLCSTAFIDYIFADPAALVEGRASPEFIARALADRER